VIKAEFSATLLES